MAVAFAVPEGWVGPPEVFPARGWRTARCASAAQAIEALGGELAIEKRPESLVLCAAGLEERLPGVARALGELVRALPEEVAAGEGTRAPLDVVDEVHCVALAAMFRLALRPATAEAYRAVLCGRRCGAAVVGRADIARRAGEALRLASLPAGPAPKWPAVSPRFSAVPYRHAGATEWLLLTFAGPPWDSPDEPVFAVVRALLGAGNSGLLFRELRHRRRLAYRVGAQWDPARSRSHLSIWAAVEPGHGREALAGVQAVLEELRRGPSEGDIARARRRVRLERELGEQRSAARAARVARALALGVALENVTGTHYLGAPSNVSRKDVCRIAQKYLSRWCAVHSVPSARAGCVLPGVG